MGLYSYLTAKFNIDAVNYNPNFDPRDANSDYILPGVSDKAKPILDALDISPDLLDFCYYPISVEIPIGHWRKCNHIHAFFIRNEFKDDCEPVPVSKDDIAQLIDRCEEVLADRSRAEELLPTRDGFFFGSTEYDDGYFLTLQPTIDRLKPLLALELECFIYQASW